MRDLLHDRDFRSPVIVQCLATAGFFVYIGGSSFVLQQELGFSQREYALCFTTNALAMAIMSASFGVLVRRVSVVPYGRMQLVEVTSGPVERHFGLASVQFVRDTRRRTRHLRV